MNVEERLERVLGARADALDIGAGFAADDILAAGRAARLRRRRTAVAGAVAAIVAIAVAAGTLALVRSIEGRAPNVPASPSTMDTRSATAPPGTVSAASIGLTVLAGDVLVTPEGLRHPLSLPSGVHAYGAIAVPSGWVVEADETSRIGLWFAPRDGDPVRIGGLFGNMAVSPDGRTLVATGVSEPVAVSRYELPSLRQLPGVTFDSGMGPIVGGVTADWVILHGAQGSPGPSTAAAWRPATNELLRTDREVQVWGVTVDGDVLRRVFQGPNDRPPTSGCVDVVPAAQLDHVAESGVCSADLAPLEMSALVSPAGEWAVLAGYGLGLRVVRVADLHAGKWSPVPIPSPVGAVPMFWTAGDTFVAGSEGSYLYCRPDSGCAPIAAPPGLTDWKPVPVSG